MQRDELRLKEKEEKQKKKKKEDAERRRRGGVDGRLDVLRFLLVGNDDSITSVLLEHDGLKRPVSWRAITTRLVFATTADCDELKRVDKRCDSSRLGEVVEAALNSRIQQAERLLDSAREMEDLIAMLIAMWKAPLGCGNNNEQPHLGCQRFQMACQSAGILLYSFHGVDLCYAPGVSEFGLPSPLLGCFSVFAGVGECTREGNDLHREMMESGVIKLGDKQVSTLRHFVKLIKMGMDTIQLEDAVSTIFGEYLLEFTSEYDIPEGLHPELPGPKETIVDFPEGKVGVYTKFFEFANYRIPLS
ncbi:hypothetical protein Tco_0927570 [Tanacetum coccineum]